MWIYPLFHRIISIINTISLLFSYSPISLKVSKATIYWSRWIYKMDTKPQQKKLKRFFLLRKTFQRLFKLSSEFGYNYFNYIVSLRILNTWSVWETLTIPICKRSICFPNYRIINIIFLSSHQHRKIIARQSRHSYCLWILLTGCSNVAGGYRNITRFLDNSAINTWPTATE